MKAVELTFKDSKAVDGKVNFHIEGGISFLLHSDRYQYTSAQMLVGRESLDIRGDLVNGPATRYLNTKRHFNSLQQEFKAWKSPKIHSFFESYFIDQESAFEDIQPTRVYDFDYLKKPGESAKLIPASNEPTDSIMLKLDTGLIAGYFLPNIKCPGVTPIVSYAYKEYKTTGFSALYCIENNSTLVIPITVFGAAKSKNYLALLINYSDGDIKVVERMIENDNKQFTVDDAMIADVFSIEELVEENMSFESLLRDDIYTLNSKECQLNREKDYQTILDN